MPIDSRLQKLLDESGIEYELLHHREDFRAQDTAADTHTPLGEFAKTLVVEIDDEFAIAAVPASHHLSPSRLARSLGAELVRMARESDMPDAVPGCEIGAAPPMGELFGLRTYASPLLAEDEYITFNAGTHRDAIRMRWRDYERIAKPEIVPMSHHESEA